MALHVGLSVNSRGAVDALANFLSEIIAKEQQKEPVYSEELTQILLGLRHDLKHPLAQNGGEAEKITDLLVSKYLESLSPSQCFYLAQRLILLNLQIPGKLGRRLGESNLVAKVVQLYLVDDVEEMEFSTPTNLYKFVLGDSQEQASRNME